MMTTAGQYIDAIEKMNQHHTENAEKLETIKRIVIDALHTDETEQKQYYLKQILMTIEDDPDVYSKI